MQCTFWNSSEFASFVSLLLPPSLAAINFYAFIMATPENGIFFVPVELFRCSFESRSSRAGAWCVCRWIGIKWPSRSRHVNRSPWLNIFSLAAAASAAAALLLLLVSGFLPSRIEVFPLHYIFFFFFGVGNVNKNKCECELMQRAHFFFCIQSETLQHTRFVVVVV